MKAGLLPLVLAAAIAGCALPREIPVLHAPPAVPYDTVETFTVHQPYMGDLHDEILDKVRREGARVGADAVFLTDRHINRTFDHLGGWQDSPEEFVTGTAIRYKKAAPSP